MSEITRYILGIITGVVATIALFCLAIAIGCAVNGVTFGQQICGWFGSCAPLIEEGAETIVDKVTQVPLA